MLICSTLLMWEMGKLRNSQHILEKILALKYLVLYSRGNFTSLTYLVLYSRGNNNSKRQSRAIECVVLSLICSWLDFGFHYQTNISYTGQLKFEIIPEASISFILFFGVSIIRWDPGDLVSDVNLLNNFACDLVSKLCMHLFSKED